MEKRSKKKKELSGRSSRKRAHRRQASIEGRLRAAEHALNLLIKNKLPKLKQFVFNAGFDLRTFGHQSQVDDLSNAPAHYEDLITESKIGGHIRLKFDKTRIRGTLFYHEKISKEEAFLYSLSFGEIIALTYAALGLDMNGAVALNEKTI